MIKGSCQSRRKVVTHNSKRDLPLVCKYTNMISTKLSLFNLNYESFKLIKKISEFRYVNKFQENFYPNVLLSILRSSSKVGNYCVFL